MTLMLRADEWKARDGSWVPPGPTGPASTSPPAAPFPGMTTVVVYAWSCERCTACVDAARGPTAEGLSEVQEPVLEHAAQAGR